MDQARFDSLMRRGRLLKSDYGAGYQRGLRRHFHGERFGTDAEHHLWMAMADSPDVMRALTGRGYRDGVEGREPEPPRGRPPVALDEARSAFIRVRVSEAQRQRFEALGGAEWLRERIDKARP